MHWRLSVLPFLQKILQGQEDQQHRRAPWKMENIIFMSAHHTHFMDQTMTQLFVDHSWALYWKDMTNFILSAAEKEDITNWTA